MVKRGNLNICVILVLVVLLWTGAGHVWAGTWYVDDDGGGPGEDGSWEHPFDTIQEGVDATSNGDTVIVANGTYAGRGNRDIDFGGRAITLQSTNPNDPNVVAATIIDASGNPGYRGFNFRSGEDTNSVVDGFTIINGLANFGGGIECDGGSPTISNCVFSNNTAVLLGGGIESWYSSPTISNCTFIGNTAGYNGGGISCSGGNPTINNCTITGNTADAGGGIYCEDGSNATISDCNISGNTADFGGGIFYNESDPPVSHCTFSGNTADAGGGIYCYNSSPTISNCTINGGNTANWFGGGIYCDVNTTPTISDCNISGNTAGFNGGGIACYMSSSVISNCTISSNTADSGGGIDYNGASSPAVTNSTISANNAVGDGGGIYCHGASNPTISNCTITGNTAYDGGGIESNYNSSPTINDSTFTGNTVIGNGGGLYCAQGNPTISNSTFNGNTANWQGGAVYCDDILLTCDGSTIDDIAGRVIGNSSLNLGSAKVITVPDFFTVSQDSNITGTGTIIVSAGAEMVIDGNTIVDLAHATDPNANGTIQCNGLLRVKDNAIISNAKINVTRASFEGDVDISNSVITAEAGAPYGQFFIEDTVHIAGNDIHADGDRYMDLDPAVFAGVIANNRIFVTITEGVGQARGGLLELRGDPNFAEPPCEPNEFFCQLDNMPAFDANSWTIERLELVEGAKVNLTNRFDFGNGGLYEVMYVKNLVLGPNSLLNTAFNQLYYKSLDGDPNSVRNEPLLGFSLSNIAFDNENEFITRVMHNNFIDPDPSPPDYTRIHVERVTGLAPDPNGMMRMCNLRDIDPNSPSYQEVINARAKGLFAKASEDEVVILFEYLFGTSDPNTELVVYLSDVPELLDPDDPQRAAHYIEVARLSPPPAGRYGSAGSSHFGVFERIVSAGDLNFIRGVRMELELVGPAGTCMLINNWDPFVSCIFYCGDVTGDNGITVRDYLTVLGEYGKLSGYDDCLNGIFSGDGYVNTTDLMGVDWLDFLRSGMIGSFCFDCLDEFELPGFGVPVVPCGNGSTGPSAAMFASETASSPGPLTTGLAGFEGSLLIAGKRFDTDVPDFLSDRLYGFDEDCNFISGPFAMDNDRLNGRLVRDYEGVLYQLNLEEGLVRLSDGNSVIPRDQGFPVDSEPRNGGPAAVYIGFQNQGESTWGRPIMDAAFDSEGYVYITPVVVVPVVVPDFNEPYIASAKLELVPDETPPYHVVQIYDDPPLPDDNQDPANLREIEIDEQGSVYVINNCYTNNSDILWVYDSNGQVIKRCELQNLGIYAPIGLCCSSFDNSRLYLASSLNDPNADSTTLYIISKDDLMQSSGDPNIQTVDVNGMGHITDITEDPLTGTLWVVGFTMPDYIADVSYRFPTKLSEIPQFYEPNLAEIPYDSNEPIQAISLLDADDLALPMSIVWTVTQEKCGRADLDGTGDIGFGDLEILASQWLQALGTPSADIAPWPGGDGIVNLKDMAILADHWLETGCN